MEDGEIPEVIQADARHIPLRDESVQTVVTSPPYYNLRDYGLNSKGIGLEASLEEYIEQIVLAFREVRRVLRPDGSCWVNLGDAYEDKQLMGIPWKIAFALQQPYYTGRIKKLEDRVWLASMVDGEGCMFIHRRKAGTPAYSKFRKKDGTEVEYTRTIDTFGAGLEVSNCHKAIVERCLEITGVGSICDQSEAENFRRKQRIYRWNLRTNECRRIIHEIYPYLVGKQHEARLVIGCPSSGNKAAEAHRSLIALHNGGTATIDFDEPKSLYEPGWFLRSDIIWAKKNCMPESVTDRPTKSHEYIFLLAKSEKYYYDADAIREPAAYGYEAKWDPGTDGLGGDDRKTGKSTRRFSQNKTVKERNDNGNHRSGGFTLPIYRNKRSVWTVATQPYADAHFATFPEDLIKPCILAGTSARGCCAECGAPWERVVEIDKSQRIGPPSQGGNYQNRAVDEQVKVMANGYEAGRQYPSKTIGWRPGCGCNAQAKPCVVLDPFAGSGTTVKVARDLGRIGIGLDLKPEYIAMAKIRAAQLGLMV